MPDPEPELLGEKEYAVVGPHDVHGAKTGESVFLNLTEAEEAFYVAAGHLREVKKGKPDG